MKAIDLILAQPWAIQPDSLETICRISLRENESVEAVAAKLGRPLENTHEVTHRDGVAIVPVSGPIFRRANIFTRISGATSIDTLATDFTAAVTDPEVSAIVLEIDSPGGQVTGINEFAGMIKSARGIKPIIAYVGGMGASAAYWIASAADSIVLDASASVGSIGVVAAFDAPEKDNSIEIVSNQSPDKRLDVSTDKGKAKIQAHVDRLADVFVEFVADARNESVDTVLANFGKGGVLVGSDAVDVGMADAVGSLEGVIQQLNAESVMDNEQIIESTALTAEHIAENHADIAATFRKEGATAECARIQDVLAQSMPGTEAIIQGLAFDGKTTGAEAAVQVLAQLREQGTEALTSLQSEAPEAVGIDSVVDDDSAEAEETQLVAAMAAGGNQ